MVSIRSHSKKTWFSSNLAPEIATAARLKTDLNTKIPSVNHFFGISWQIMAMELKSTKLDDVHFIDFPSSNPLRASGISLK